MPTQLPADINLQSPQIKLIHEWNEGFVGMNPDILGKCVHKDFRRVVYPASMGQPAQSKEEWIKDITGIMSFATGFDVNVHSIIEAPGKVVIHSTSEVQNPIGIDTKSEGIFIVHIVTDEDGSLKIKQIDDFRDSKAYLELVKSMGAAVAAAQANK